ncbi:Carboxymuconolactone decarboxylase family protein [Aquimixticola soesokkakensis]|uniref:Carboxymuconolactone decarboxylase family protein n=1 Tax=Aquimixticola soesokkakensis TaxID=1519096 RepID=A0A1Y5RYL8_9RHOB|nr:carboxymuconolactone decarboxylase family protein [Aquimixticola soesokkakensis]SLN28257.1 Carboxymuconolactone decarboxylase family protein [Aquimixticola soesokkakensis]
MSTLDLSTQTHASAAPDQGAALSEALGISHPSLATIARMDPALAGEFAAMARAVRDANVLSLKEQALIMLAINAAVVHLNGDMVRAYIQAALAQGASAGEIREVLQLTSVLGIHGTLPGTLILTEAEGGLEAMQTSAAPERRARAELAQANFEAKRGPMTPAWVSCTYHLPDLVEAYAGFSGVPWASDHLSAQFKELIYVAIDLMPQHTHMEGTKVHMKKARALGASDAQINSVLQMIALMGVQTHMLALPILEEELARAGL